MASTATTVRRVPASVGYRRLVVPISGTPESDRAVEVACAVAAEHGSELTALYVIEVSQLLPLDARMDQEEAAARTALRRAEGISDAFGVRFHARTIRAREAGRAIVELAEQAHADIVVIPASRRPRAYGRSRFGAAVRYVLAKAPSRVLLVTPPAA